MIWKPWPARNILDIIEARQIWLNRLFHRDTIEGIFWKLFLGSTCKAQYTCKADELINVPLPISKEKLFSSSETGDHAPSPILDQIKEEERGTCELQKRTTITSFFYKVGERLKKNNSWLWPNGMFFSPYPSLLRTWGTRQWKNCGFIFMYLEVGSWWNECDSNSG